jgi:exodeoxyribonuclease V beta subunit
MTETTQWTGLEDLEEGKTILLEASAGTGKTWQIEGLVVRLVAEYDVRIDKILVITFTNAATAELRDRVRRRLVQARDAMEGVVEPSGDPIVSALWAAEETRGLMQSRLAAAVSSFDMAAISTIHGFSQRMLDQLAFESGQEPGLELQHQPELVLRRLVEDALATVYAEATEEELRSLADMGWTRDELGKLAKAMTKAVAPVLEPTVPAIAGTPGTPLEVVAQWVAAKQDLTQWLDSDAGIAAIEAVRQELALKKGKRVKGMRKDVVGKNLDGLRGWLAGAALRSDRLGTGKGNVTTALKNLQFAALEKVWVGPPDSPEGFAGAPLFERVSALVADQDRLWPQPLLTFASGVRAHVEAELTRRGKLTFSTMLSRLAERIASQSRTHGADGQLANAIRGRFKVALVDEFQDTDGAQWPVMRTVFAGSEHRLLIIGDPKQAIYAFRGADVHVYLDAAQVADHRATMRTNWRSDGDYVAAMNHVWAEGSQAFELGDVDYVTVEPAPGQPAARIRGLTAQGERPGRAFELRWVDGVTLEADSLLVGSKVVGAEGTARLAAAEAARLLGGGTEIEVCRDDEGGSTWRPLQPGDIAVLVRTNAQAEQMRAQLERLGIPSVSGGRGSVMSSPVLGWLCAWLDAVADPGRDRPARALATCPLFGWTALDLATALSSANAAPGARLTEAETQAWQRWDAWLQNIKRWAGQWQKHGFVRVFERALDDFNVLRRVLGGRQGERYGTDLRHLVELGHAEERRTRLGPSGLASWLRAARDEVAAKGGAGADEAQALRLESDARAVQLVTIHKSKGLEFPVVLLPFGWADFQSSDKGGPLEWHAAMSGAGASGGTELRLNLEVSGTPGRQRAATQAAVEARQEQLRLLYVALTRARHHCVAWLGPLGRAALDQDSYALGRILLRERDGSGVPVSGGACPVFPKDTTKAAAQAQVAEQQAAVWADVTARLERLADSSEGTVGWSHEPPAQPPERVSLELGVGAAINATPWPTQRSLGSAWMVSSYSAMVAGRTFDASEPQRPGEVLATTPARVDTQPGDGDEGTDGARVDLREPKSAAEEAEALNEALNLPIGTSALRGGADIGTWTHEVLEHLDFQSAEARDGRPLAALLANQGGRNGVRATGDHALLAQALPLILDTPLDGGPTGLAAGFSLRTLLPKDRLDELGFDLRLGQGSRWRHAGSAELAAGEGGRLNIDGARLALQSRVGDMAWGGDPWLRAVLDRAEERGVGVLPRIAGILTGFVDLTFRAEVRTAGGDTVQRYFVADYKTNRIGSPGRRRDSRCGHYTHAWMAWEMAHHGYHLQSLLYTVALHRLLGQRCGPSYSYETHVGGHLYLFLRGMAGAEGHRDQGSALGVFADRWPASVVLGLDAALSGASSDEVRAIINVSTGGAADPTEGVV